MWLLKPTKPEATGKASVATNHPISILDSKLLITKKNKRWQTLSMPLPIKYSKILQYNPKAIEYHWTSSYGRQTIATEQTKTQDELSFLSYLKELK